MLLICVLALLCVCCTSVVVIAETTPKDPREQTKERLMYQIKNQGWDPYSSNMTVEEFYALMELIEEGKIPLDAENDSGNKKPVQSLPNFGFGSFFAGPSFAGSVEDPGAEEPPVVDGNLIIPREKFIFSGIADDYKGDYPPLEYKNANNYEPYDPDTNALYTVVENENEEDTDIRFELDGIEYVLKEDGRLYNEDRLSLYTPAKGIFEVGGVYFALGDDGNLYYCDGTGYSLEDGTNAKSVSGTEYTWLNNVFYNAETGAEYNESGEYYYDKSRAQAYEWRKGAMCIVGIGTPVDSEVIKNLAYHYPKGLDPENIGYKRPSMDWAGIKLNDKNQAVIIKEEENTGSIGGYANQDLFLELNGYYVKDVTVNGIDAKILGMLKVKDGNTEKYVYYYLSSDDQDMQVSTTMLPDAQKFVVQYVPREHLIDYKVEMATLNGDGTYSYEDVTADWVDTLFGADRPLRSTDGAYAFSVVTPYFYQTSMILSHTVTISDVSYDSNQEIKEVALEDIEEAYSGTRNFGQASTEGSKKILLDAYEKFLAENGITSFSRGSITQSQEADGTYTLAYTAGGADAAAHQKVLDRIAERMSKHLLLNNGYALGTEPKYTATAIGAFISPNLNDGPETLTVNATFYNSLVRENRTVIAVLKKNSSAPWFNTPIVGASSNTNGRGTSAKMVYDKDKDYAYTEKYGVKWYDYEKEIKYYLDNNWTGNNDRGHEIGNLYTADEWGWDSSSRYGDKESERNHAMYDMGDGTYFFQWTFQTNNGAGGYTLDTFAVNGLSMKIPFLPHYSSPAGKYSVAAGPDGMNGYRTTLTLPDGATVTLDFVAQFHERPQQRVYRVTVEHAKSDVSITGMNLMQGDGASEVALLELVGVYAPEADGTEKSQSEPAIQIYTVKDRWARFTTASIIVNNNDDEGGTKYGREGGSNNQYGANIRFKSIEGYGNPYYLFEATKDGVIGGQASAKRDSATDVITEHNNAASLADFINSGENELKPGVVYKDDTNDEGWYYLRLTGQGDYRIGLLTIIARPARYVLQYMPFVIWQWNEEEGKIEQAVDEKGQTRAPVGMPTFTHYGEHGSFIVDGYDDNSGFYYDAIYNSTAPLPTNNSGVIHPADPTGKYTFTGWVVADYTSGEGRPLIDEDGNMVIYLNRAIDIMSVNDYAELDVNIGSDDIDVYVITLVPTWKVVENPFYYNVVLNWVDAQGKLNQENFSQYWKQVLTEKPEGDYLYVYLNKDAGPLLDWIAQYPTYTFWDEINNAHGANEAATIEAALEKYLKMDNPKTPKAEILKALKQKDYTGGGDKYDESNGFDDFERLGGDSFAVLENHGTISIWMYENKGGLVFHKDVKREPFAPNDEFYFTVTQVYVGDGSTLLNGEYKAYPEAKYIDNNFNKYVFDKSGLSTMVDDQGNPIRLITDDDAWTVTFRNGNIDEISKGGLLLKEKNDKGDFVNVKYFTLMHDEGIELYVPEGTYTVVELGSKSGGSYKAHIEYTSSDGRDVSDGWSIPDGNFWVRGSSKNYYVSEAERPNGVSQIKAQVKFEVGAHNVVQTLIFYNQTISLSIEKSFGALEENKEDIPKSYDDAIFTITLKLKLPESIQPIEGKNEDGSTYYYFNANHYTVKYEEDKRTGKMREVLTPVGDGTVKLEFTNSGENIWSAVLKIKAKERFVVVMIAEEGVVNYWVEESSNVPGFVYKELISGEGEKPKYKYTYYKEDAANVPEGAEEATLAGMDLTPLISPSQGKAKVGDKADIKVENWFGELPGYGYIKITANGGDKNETFLFKITSSRNTDIIFIVAVKGGASVYVYVPCGSYTIEEISEWSWRYEDGKGTATDPTDKPDENSEEEQEPAEPSSGPLNITVNVNNDSRKNAIQVEYSHTPNYKGWLGGESSTQNSFKKNQPVNGE